jgi:hypothetical protein
MRATTAIDYIVQRLADEGFTDSFGLPSPYGLPICEAVERSSKIKWIGCSNELPFGDVGNSKIGKDHGRWGSGQTQTRAGLCRTARTLTLAVCVTAPLPKRTLRQIVMPS